MKKLFLSVFSYLIVTSYGQSQINLIGVYANENTRIVDVAKWNPYDSNSLQSFPTNLLGWTTNTALFNPANNNYYLRGVVDGSGGLFTFNALTNEHKLFSSVPDNSFSNSSEIDLSTGLIYNVFADTNRNLIITEFNPESLISRTVGIINDNEPNPEVNRVDASGFDSDNGLLYYAGNDGVTPCLYRIPVRNSVFAWSKVALPSLDSANTYYFLNFDNTNNILYAATKGEDSVGNQYNTRIIEINTVTGEVTTRGTIPLLPLNPVGGVSAFDQESGSLLLIGYSIENLSNVEQGLFIFNTSANTYQRGYIPGFVSEIVCDNFNYARKRYRNTSSITATQKLNASLYPNPAKGKCILFVSDFKTGTPYQVVNSNGQVFITGIIRNSNTEIPVGQLSKGLYFIILGNEKAKQSYRLAVY